MIRNYLWGGITSGKVRAKVKWDTIIQLMTQGGLKIIGPATKARALLAKLIARGLTPGLEPWKIMVRHRIEAIRFKQNGQ